MQSSCKHSFETCLKKFHTLSFNYAGYFCSAATYRLHSEDALFQSRVISDCNSGMPSYDLHWPSIAPKSLKFLPGYHASNKQVRIARGSTQMKRSRRRKQWQTPQHGASKKSLGSSGPSGVAENYSAFTTSTSTNLLAAWQNWMGVSKLTLVIWRKALSHHGNQLSLMLAKHAMYLNLWSAFL